MPRRKKNKSINLEGLRRKCSDTGRVGQVAHIHIQVPPSNRNYNPKEEGKVIDTTGAGDSFNGALASGLEKGFEIKECLNFAIKASGISTTKKGAADAMPTIKDLS